jgi:hypothetical protein
MTISAKIIADSISPAGVRITTFELEYPRFIHAEFMTHRMFSRNAASSRAIPVNRAIELIRENIARPIHWGKNQPGMSAKEEHNALIHIPSSITTTGDWTRELCWWRAGEAAIQHAEAFNAAGYHKQIVNRLLEPFTHIKVVCTATEFNNFWWLRNHPDAQPEIQELARVMLAEFNKSEPLELCQGDWHVPYYEHGDWTPTGSDFDEGPQRDIHGRTLQEAIAISASCCAQVSYRKLDDSLEKAQDIYKRLVESEPVHASPFEHQATPMHEYHFREDEDVLLYINPENETLDSEGITHFDRYGKAWSGNFRGWIQNRQLIPNNVKRG